MGALASFQFAKKRRMRRTGVLIAVERREDYQERRTDGYWVSTRPLLSIKAVHGTDRGTCQISNH